MTEAPTAAEARTTWDEAIREVFGVLSELSGADSATAVVYALIEAARRCCDTERDFETAVFNAREQVVLRLDDTGAQRVACLWYGRDGEVALDVGADGVWRMFHSRPGISTALEFPGKPTDAAASFAGAIGDALRPIAQAAETSAHHGKRSRRKKR